MTLKKSFHWIFVDALQFLIFSVFIDVVIVVVDVFVVVFVFVVVVFVVVAVAAAAADSAARHPTAAITSQTSPYRLSFAKI